MPHSKRTSGITGSSGKISAEEQSLLFALADVPVAIPEPKVGKAADDRHGHRERLRTRFRDGGAEAVPDYELLEMILFRAFPRIDTKPIAKRLMKEFGTFAEVIMAPRQRLLEIEGVGARTVDELKLIKAAAERLVRGEIKGKTALSSWSSVLDYLRMKQGFEGIEHFRVIYLDKKNNLIADEEQGRGTVDHTPVYVREVVKRALELSASAIILVHNHPTIPFSIPLDHAQAH